MTPESPQAAPTLENADQEAVFAFLADPTTHGGAPVERIDTHGAAVFLAGPFAYKVKRAVYFPFMDFSTLEKRRRACEGEMEVNGANAPQIYRGVVPIVRGPKGLHFGADAQPADGPKVEYAVRMGRFDSAATLDRLAQRGPLSPDVVRGLAEAVTASHAAAPERRGADVVGALASYLADNRRIFAANPLFPAADAARLAERAEAELDRLAPLLKERAARGFVRRCHGDLHLRNIVLVEGRPVLFDAIEFNEQIATCDLLYDLAFLLMDLIQRGHAQEANTVLNRYLWRADEAHIEGLAALPFFLSLRAAIRSKVEAAGLGHLPEADRAAARTRITALFASALADLEPGDPPKLLAVGGLSGSGKTTWAMRTAPLIGRAPGAVVVRSDIVRKRLFGVGETEKLPPDGYAPGMTERVYAHVRDVARRVLTTGRGVIVDAVHARPAERAAIEEVAGEAGVAFEGVWLEAPPDVLAARVAARVGDASDATADVVARQLTYDLGDISWRRVSV